MKIDRWVIGIGMIFLYTFMAGGYFLYVAVSSDTGKVTENAYQDSQRYQDTIDSLKESRALGWKIAVNTEAVPLELTLKDASGKKIEGALITFHALSGAKKNLTREDSFQEDAERGIYQLSRPLPMKGIWIATISATYQKREFLWKENILIQ